MSLQQESYPTPRHHPDLVSPLRTSRPPRKAKKPWQSRMSLGKRNTAQTNSEEWLGRDSAQPTVESRRQKRQWWKINLFEGMINDIRRRAPFYLSDWTDAWNYRVVPATIYMYFAKYVPINLQPVIKHSAFPSYVYVTFSEFRTKLSTA